MWMLEVVKFKRGEDGFKPLDKGKNNISASMYWSCPCKSIGLQDHHLKLFDVFCNFQVEAIWKFTYLENLKIKLIIQNVGGE
jgi:hypothetical protein